MLIKKILTLPYLRNPNVMCNLAPFVSCQYFSAAGNISLIQFFFVHIEAEKSSRCHPTSHCIRMSAVQSICLSFIFPRYLAFIQHMWLFLMSAIVPQRGRRLRSLRESHCSPFLKSTVDKQHTLPKGFNLCNCIPLCYDCRPIPFVW